MGTRSNWYTCEGTAPHHQWQIADEGTGKTIAITYDDKDGENAQLIAAAPAMYAVIKDMREAFYVKGTRKALLEVMERSKDVIAQAEGRQG